MRWVLSLSFAIVVPHVLAADARALAQRKFADGEAAFERRDFSGAAAQFDEANRLVPSLEALFNSAQAWHRAKERLPAATRFERYLVDSPAGHHDREKATRALNELRPFLGRLILVVSGQPEVQIDGEPLSLGVTGRFVVPGQHLISSRWGAGEVISQVFEIDAGQELNVALTPPRPAVTSVPDIKSAPPAPQPSPALREPTPNLLTTAVPNPWRLSHWALLGMGSLVVVSAGLTVGSGIDTLGARSSFDLNPSATALSQGQFRQDRTNVLFWATSGLLAATIAVAVWVVLDRPPTWKF